jgi:transposase
VVPEFQIKSISSIVAKQHCPAKALAATLTPWLELIVGMWRFSKSNGITEGFHTKMEMISRRAFEFRSSTPKGLSV